ncbi:MAG: neutral/alkaline non-lysosomal ceramidase N-terminal domain-containing protein [Armatimonadota bacterium]
MAEVKAGVSKVDITPHTPVWMDGMIREHKSEGVHDPLFARALYISSGEPDRGCVIVSADICAIRAEDASIVRREASSRTGVPAENIVIAATHTHSGPATKGFFNPLELEYVANMRERLVDATVRAVADARTAVIGSASGKENTISQYRRLLADDGHVVMNWEEWPAERIVRVLGEPDEEVGVVAVAEANNPDRYMCVLFNHAGHPNVMSGENYLISADYPGWACAKIEERVGGVAIFVNGAEGSVDIDGLKDRDWQGVARAGGALADAVIETLDRVQLRPDIRICSTYTAYELPRRRITREELEWAENVIAVTSGRIEAHADGVGDDYRAVLYKRLSEARGLISVEQTCIALGETALVSFPGELFTEIGGLIKVQSPFARTYIIGLANGCLGYVPTREAICQGGYEVEVRELGDEAAEIVVEKTLELLNSCTDHVFKGGSEQSV